MSLIRTKFTLLVLALVGTMGINAQQIRCSSVEATQQLIANHPIAAKGFREADRETEEILAKYPTGSKERVVITIPVVVHVVYQNATQNISDAQVQSQITALNKDYRRTNTDAGNTPSVFQGVASDTEIEFCLATKDPNGNATTGILHVAATGQYTNVNQNFGTTNDEKSASTGGSTIWNRNKYLNIWVCNLGNNLLGYAYQPGGPASIDGVVIDYRYFGTMGTATAPYNKGRTATHEVGHWLNLDHIWGDDGGACTGSDNVADTPNQADEHYQCPSFPQVSCTNGPNGDMFMNYMDYVDDNCMNMFTAGQKARMVAALNGPRVSLLTSDGCSGGTSQTTDAGVTNIVAPGNTICTTTFQPQVTMTNGGNTTITSATFNYTITSGPSGSYNWTGNLGVGSTVTVTLPAVTVTAGAHTITITVSNPNNATDGNASNNSSSKSFTVTSGTAGVAAPFSETFQGTFPGAGWTVNNPNNDAYLWATYSNGGQASSKSVYINNFNNNVKGTIDEFVLPAINTTTTGSPVVNFWVAHKYYPYTNSQTGETWIDTLQVLYSIDCGATYTSLGKLSGIAMVNNTTTDTLGASAFVPTSESNWKQFYANLPSNSSVIIKFRNIAQYGQNIYVDNINVTGAVGIEDMITESTFSVYPNPASGQFVAKYEATKRATVAIDMLELTGKQISHHTFDAQEGANEFSVSLDNLATGYYLVRLTVGDKTAIRKLVVE